MYNNRRKFTNGLYLVTFMLMFNFTIYKLLFRQKPNEKEEPVPVTAINAIFNVDDLDNAKKLSDFIV